MTAVWLVAGTTARVQADAVSAPSLIISQLKITSRNGQFVTLYNNTPGALDMSRYQLTYFNHYDAAKATSSRLITLSGILPPHSYYMINDSALQICYQLTLNSLSLGFSSTAGYLQLLAFSQAMAGGPFITHVEDYVAWSKTVVPGVQTLPSSTAGFLQRLPASTQGDPLITTAGHGTWQAIQPSPDNSCQFLKSDTDTVVSTGSVTLLPGTEPPASFITASSLETKEGMLAPVITELLPNPFGTGTDATDEFVELYNPNEIDFELSGLKLQTGTSSVHTYIFPPGTTLPGGSFRPFFSSVTGLSLSNTGSQARLLDANGSVLSATDAYAPAAEGQAWARANGAWYWTGLPTPGEANKILSPGSSGNKASTLLAAAKPKAAAVPKAPKTPKLSKPPKAKKAKTAKKAVSAKTGYGTAARLERAPVQVWVLALAAGLALLYVAYEYRTDLANRIYQFRSYRAARRIHR